MPNVIGEPLDRVDGRLKVTGSATYSAEYNIPNIAYASMRVATIAKGRIASIDTSVAERVPGVLAVMTHKSPARTLQLAQDPMGKQATTIDRRLQLLQGDRVYYANQPVAVAVAETLEGAQEAARLIQIRYAPERPSITIEQSIASAYVPEKAGGAQDPGISSRGDVAAGLAQADARVERVYTSPFQTHNPMEPHATIAMFEDPQHLTLYDATQGIFGDRKRVAELLGLPVENVRVISRFLGGGFGSKGPTWSHVVLCAMAARQVSRPVKLVLDRPQMFGPIGFRSATRQSISAGAKSDGTLTALRNNTITHTSTFDEFTETATLPTRMLYAVPNNSTEQKLVRSDIGTPSYMRAPGESTGTFALEIAMDELAYTLKMDPVALRLKNYADRDENRNLPWSTKSLRQCYEMGADRFGWSKRQMEPRSMREGNSLIGWGMATAVYPARRQEAAAMARLNRDGTLLVDAGTQDLGGGTYTVMTQIAAQTMGVDPSKVTFRLGDTQYPETPVSGGSQTAASVGSAVMLAVQALREKVIRRAIADPQSPVYGAAMEEVAIDNGRIFKDSSGENLAALIARNGQPFIEAAADTKPGEEVNQYSMFSFGAQFAEVRVDADLGQIRVSRMLGVFAPGRILNSKLARSQFLGGMVWGVSFALYENTVYDPNLVRIVNNNLAEYHVPTNMDIGEMEALTVNEVDDHVDPVGVKGVGEIGITGSVAAVANAIYHATGKRVRDVPITLDKLL